MPVSSPTTAPTAAQHAHATRMSATLIVLMLATLLGIQPVTTDLYLPALPALTAGFGAPMSQAQLTLSALLLAFGVSQLLWGPLSDRFGRRPILLWGLSAYTLASIGSALAPSMELLIIWRVVQGAAMGAVVMCARAIVRDLYLPVEGARVMSKGLTGLGVIACLSAPLGGLLSELYGWRAALTAVALFGGAAWVLIALRFEETVPQKSLDALHPRTLTGTWLKLFRHPTFLAFSALSAASYAGLFTFLASSSFVFIGVLGLSRTVYGLIMLVSSLAYIAGTFICRHLLPRHGVRKTVALAAVLSVTGGTVMGVLALAGVQSVWAIMLPHMLFMLGHGVHQPCGQSGAIGPFPQSAGAASAMNGFLMMVAAFAMGGWLGHRLDGTVLPMTNGMWLWSVVIATVAWTLVRRHGEPAAPSAAPSAAR